MNSSSRHRQRSRIVILRLSPANLAAFSDPPLMLKSDQNDNDHLDPALRAKDAQPSFFDTALNAMEIMIPAPQSVVRGGSVASTTDSLSTIQSDDPRLDLSSCEIAPICSMTPNTLGKRTAAEFQRDNDTKGQMEPETDGSENRSKKAKQTDETSAAAPINDGEDIDAPHELDDGYSRSAVNNASV